MRGEAQGATELVEEWHFPPFRVAIGWVVARVVALLRLTGA